MLDTTIEITQQEVVIHIKEEGNTVTVLSIMGAEMFNTLLKETILTAKAYEAERGRKSKEEE